MLQGLFLYCIFQLRLVLLQFKENFFLLSLHQNYLFEQTLYSHKWYKNIPYSQQMSHDLSCHSILSFPSWLSANICTGIYTCQAVKSSEKSLTFLLDKSFHPTRLCFHLIVSQAIPCPVSRLSHKFLSFKWDSSPQLLFCLDLFLSLTGWGQSWGHRAGPAELLSPL